MPRDQRLYMTFPNDFWQHPKIALLSDAAFRVFVEMNGYSRMQDLDGRVPVNYVKRMWRYKAVNELMTNHPDRPSLIRDGDFYVIWNYAEHQMTKADRQRIAEISKANGARGGRPKRNPDVTQGVSVQNPDVTQTKAEIETEVEIETRKSSAPKRAHSIDLQFAITPAMREWAAANVPLVNIDAKLPEFIDYWHGVGKAMKDWESVWRNGMRKQQEFALRDKKPVKASGRAIDNWFDR